MASFRKRGSRWTAEVRRKGQYRTATFANKTAARQWATETEAWIDAGGYGVDVTLAQTMQRYSDEVSPSKRGKRWEQIRLGRFMRTLNFANKRLDEITPAVLSNWRDQRLQEVAPSTVRRELVLLSGVMEIARREWGWIQANPVRDVRKPANPPARDQIITESQVVCIMAQAGYTRGMRVKLQFHVVGAAFDFALETAMRASEICRIEGEDVDLARRYLILPMTKNGYRREVPLSSAAVDILSSLDTDIPFPIDPNTLSTLFIRLKKAAGYHEDFTFHDARATAITRLSKRLDIHDLARMTGHRDLQSLLVYYRATASDIANQLD